MKKQITALILLVAMMFTCVLPVFAETAEAPDYDDLAVKAGYHFRVGEDAQAAYNGGNFTGYGKLTASGTYDVSIREFKPTTNRNVYIITDFTYTSAATIVLAEGGNWVVDGQGHTLTNVRFQARAGQQPWKLVKNLNIVTTLNSTRAFVAQHNVALSFENCTFTVSGTPGTALFVDRANLTMTDCRITYTPDTATGTKRIFFADSANPVLTLENTTVQVSGTNQMEGFVLRGSAKLNFSGNTSITGLGGQKYNVGDSTSSVLFDSIAVTEGYHFRVGENAVTAYNGGKFTGYGKLTASGTYDLSIREFQPTTNRNVYIITDFTYSDPATVVLAEGGDWIVDGQGHTLTNVRFQARANQQPWKLVKNLNIVTTLNSTRAFVVQHNVALSFENCTFTVSGTPEFGLFINRGDLTMKDCRITYTPDAETGTKQIFFADLESANPVLTLENTTVRVSGENEMEGFVLRGSAKLNLCGNTSVEGLGGNQYNLEGTPAIYDNSDAFVKAIGAQKTVNGSNNVRFVAYVNDSSYKSAGMIITRKVDGKSATYESHYVYTYLLENHNGTIKEVDSEDLECGVGYLLTIVLTGIPEELTEFEMTPFVVFENGGTLYGTSISINVNVVEQD